MNGSPWSVAEVEAIVADYFSMLESELRRLPYNKSEHRRALAPLLLNRTDGSIERKHQNISAILIESGFPYIRGYKPLSQYQGLLADVVMEHLEDDAVLAQLALDFVEAAPSPTFAPNVLQLMTQRPPILETVRASLSGAFLRRARKIDFLEREARNRALGRDGESLVVSYEKARLSSLGHNQLADRVEHVALTRGDGLGYDVLSFSTTGSERFIEVKTTQLGPYTPFYVTANELSFSEENATSYSLYRVYDFTEDARMFSLDGSVGETCSMRASQYLASPR